VAETMKRFMTSALSLAVAAASVPCSAHEAAGTAAATPHPSARRTAEPDARTAPIAAVPSNCVHVPTRLGFGDEKKNYAATYKSAQEAIRAELPPERASLLRAYLLLKQHGQETCKSNRPRCEECVVSADCAYFRTVSGGVRQPSSG